MPADLARRDLITSAAVMAGLMGQPVAAQTLSGLVPSDRCVVGSDDLSVRDARPTIALLSTLKSRPDLPRDLFYAYYRDVHMLMSARIAGFHQYWIHFLDFDEAGLWPRSGGGLDEFTPEQRFHALGEGTLLAKSDLAGMEGRAGLLMRDEHNAFAERIVYRSTGRRSVTLVDRIVEPAPNGPQPLLKLFLFLAKRHDVELPEFRERLTREIAVVWSRATEVAKVRLHLLDPYDAAGLPTIGVSVEKAPADQYQAIVEIAFADRSALSTFLSAPAFRGTVAAQAMLLRRVHPFVEREIYTPRYAGELTLMGQRGYAAAEAIRRVGATNQTDPEVVKLMVGEPATSGR